MDAQAMKDRIGFEAARRVDSGMRLGIGTGSTAEAFVRALAERVKEGLRIVGVPTSERTARLCRDLGIPLTTLEELPELDLTIDGTDEVDGALRLIKGGGGALLREKIVASASARMLVIADVTKKVETLGAFPLPVEINGFGIVSTLLAIERAAGLVGVAGTLALRRTGDDPFITDGGHLIVDASFGRIPDPEALSAALHAIPGVVEHGLFLGLASSVMLAGPDGIEELAAD
ncbi:ribose-5-phosphate isomerase RpiA [Aureimonas pseudogalii]|uniref:Ribose-5-phosphate isomerase A n=1 Tax=Aureimonas pseudogalii TaxID=1744844 RepID=A0A7W6MKQ1_9HYPH|nr:ribose-5-phosphate isomerase RpiA [Aureimonas pseudogalii]MBB3999135.1 ribose 5-phosphate isomerase A [Aureimonas pseudogalii]